jgi:hypothetical protein
VVEISFCWVDWDSRKIPIVLVLILLLLVWFVTGNVLCFLVAALGAVLVYASRGRFVYRGLP